MEDVSVSQQSYCCVFPVHRVATLPWKSMKISWKFVSIFQSPGKSWKRIWCLIVLEFSVGGPWKCLNSEIVNPRCKKWYSHSRIISSIVNISITYWLDAVEAVSQCNIPGVPKKVTPFWYLSFLPLLHALFASFVYLHTIFIKCLISEPNVVSIQMDSSVGWCTIAHCEQ